MKERRKMEMSLVRFTLNGIEAFRNKAKDADLQHVCVDCARGQSKKYTLIPFLDRELRATLSDFGNGNGAMISCDKCGGVIATHYPEAFWTGHEAGEGGDHRSLIFRKF
jgi:hypothetical protein